MTTSALTLTNCWNSRASSTTPTGPVMVAERLRRRIKLKKTDCNKKNKLITAAKKNYRAPFLGFSFQMSSYDCFLLLKFFVCKGPYTAKAIGHNACARSNEECTRPSSDFFININNQSSASSQLSFVSIGPQPWAVSALQRSDLGKEILTRL